MNFEFEEVVWGVRPPTVGGIAVPLVAGRKLEIGAVNGESGKDSTEDGRAPSYVCVGALS